MNSKKTKKKNIIIIIFTLYNISNKVFQTFSIFVHNQFFHIFKCYKYSFFDSLFMELKQVGPK